MKVLVLVVLMCLFQFIRGQTKSDATSLYDYIFTTQAYNRRIRPIDDQSQPVTITLAYHLKSINGIDEIEETLTTTGMLIIQWHDSGLVWSPTTYKGIYYMYLPQDDIWKPDIVLANGKTKIKELGGDFYYIVIRNDGLVVWYPYEIFTTKCSVDMSYFPFDKQTCDVKFTVWSYKDSDVTIDPTATFTIPETNDNSIWAIDSYSYNTETEDGVVMVFRLNLRRKPTFYVLNIILPIVILSFITTIVFVLPADSGEKIGFSVTVFLSFAIFLTIVSAELPKNSENTSIVSLYIIGEVFLSVFALIISAVQLRLHHRASSDIGRGFTGIIKFSRCIRCKVCFRQRKITVVKDANDIHEMKTEISDEVKETDNSDSSHTWADVAHAVDVICFSFFTAVNLLLTAVVFGILVLQ